MAVSTCYIYCYIAIVAAHYLSSISREQYRICLNIKGIASCLKFPIKHSIISYQSEIT